MIDKTKIAIIKIAQKQLGMCDADYRALLLRVAGVRVPKSFKSCVRRQSSYAQGRLFP